MTIREMLKKIETYNEVAKELGERELELRFHLEFSSTKKITDMKEFKKYLNYEFIPELVDAILKCDSYQISGEYVNLVFDDKFGTHFEEKVSLLACHKW